MGRIERCTSAFTLAEGLTGVGFAVGHSSWRVTGEGTSEFTPANCHTDAKLVGRGFISCTIWKSTWPFTIDGNDTIAICATKSSFKGPGSNCTAGYTLEKRYITAMSVAKTFYITLLSGHTNWFTVEGNSIVPPAICRFYCPRNMRNTWIVTPRVLVSLIYRTLQLLSTTLAVMMKL